MLLVAHFKGSPAGPDSSVCCDSTPFDHKMPDAVCMCLCDRTRQGNWKLKSQLSGAGQRFVWDAMGIQKREVSSSLEARGPSWRHSIGEFYLERLVRVS